LEAVVLDGNGSGCGRGGGCKW